MLVPARNYRAIRRAMTDPFDFFDGFIAPRQSAQGMMKTDVTETEHGYELAIDLPGVKKDNVTIELDDGYMDVSASTQSETTEKDEEGKVLRQERFSGSCSRRFYVGEDIEEDGITAKFEDGVLSISIPKKEEKPALEEKKTIAIEG